MASSLSVYICMLAAFGSLASLVTGVEGDVEDRIFLEETIERSECNLLESFLLDKSTCLEQKLIKETARLRETNHPSTTTAQIELLEELREHLYGTGQVDCDLGVSRNRADYKGNKFVRLYKEGERAESTLYKLLVRRQARNLAICKVVWDEKLKQVVARSLDERQQVAARSLYNQLAVFSHQSTYDPSERAPRFADMQMLLRAPPKPAGLVLYLSRCPAAARLLQLDSESMTNPELSEGNFELAVEASLLQPLCSAIVESQLPQLSRFYRERIFGRDHQLLMDGVWESAASAQFKRLLYSHQPLELTKWLVVEATCSRLMRPSGNLILRKTYRAIRANSKSEPLDETSVLNSDFVLSDLESKDEQFKEARRSKFVRANG